MKKEQLSSWIEAECKAKGLSYRALARALGTSATTMSALRGNERETLQADLLQAIALRRGESVAATAEWLGIDPPDADLPSQIMAIGQRLEIIERKVEFAYQAAKDQAAPSLSLASYLAEKGINVRSTLVQKKTQAIAASVTSRPSAYERFLLIVLGVIPALNADLEDVSEILIKLTQEPWTPAEVDRVLREGREG